jgi:exopolysaccharide biosynthesis polyprenyl glycosylphosphotransferase
MGPADDVWADGGEIGVADAFLSVVGPVMSGARFSAPDIEEHDHAAPKIAPVREVERREALYRRLLGAADFTAAILATWFSARFFVAAPRPAIVLVGFLAVLVAKVEGLYDRDDQVILKRGLVEWRVLLQANLLTAIGAYLAWRVITTAPEGYGMRLFLFLTIVSFALATPLRAGARLLARSYAPPERCVIVGTADRCRNLALRLSQLTGVELIGLVGEEALSGSVAQLQEVVSELGIHRLVIVPSGEPNAGTFHLIQAAKFLGVRVSLLPSVLTAVGGFARIEELDGMTLLGVPRFGLSRSSAGLKRAFDLVLGALAILFLGPLMLCIAVAIKLDSRGPVLFRQSRIGRGGDPFEIIKFRSMVAGADALKDDLRALNQAGDGLFKIPDDPRITRVGRLLRPLHLDELPQLFNVIAGEMSLVGPRPLVAEEAARFTGRDRHRLALTPGMTGPWQIRGPLAVPLSEMAMLDYSYASDWSIWKDLDILVETVMHVCGRGGL